MIQKYISVSIALSILLCGVAVYPVGGYNRYVPWLPVPYILTDNQSSYIKASGFIGTSNNAFSTADRHIGLPELYGNFDLGLLSRAAAKVLGFNPLSSYYQDKSIPFILDGSLRMQGIMLSIHQAVTPEFSVGASLVCNRFHAHIDYTLGDIKFVTTEDIKIDLFNQKRLLFDAIGISSESSSSFGLGDIDAHVSFQSEWDRRFKFRTIKAACTIGLIFPTALSWDYTAPASIFTDNNRHWGFYGSGHLTCVLKEDFTVDFGLYVYKKIPKTGISRMPVLEEPLLFGAAVGQVQVNPGVTIVCSPSVFLEHLRDGFGVAVSYSLLYHQQDSFTDKRIDQSVPVTFKMAKKLSSWGADYISLQAFYDFENNSDLSSMSSAIKLKWDIPTNIFVAKKVAKTHVISLTIGCAY